MRPRMLTGLSVLVFKSFSHLLHFQFSFTHFGTTRRIHSRPSAAIRAPGEEAIYQNIQSVLEAAKSDKYNGMFQIYLTLKHQRCIVLDGRQTIEFVFTRFAECWK